MRFAGEMFGKPLLQTVAGRAPEADGTDLAERKEARRRTSTTPSSHIKWWVAEAYYTSKIGIHDELKYQGNVYIDEFSAPTSRARSPSRRNRVD